MRVGLQGAPLLCCSYGHEGGSENFRVPSKGTSVPISDGVLSGPGIGLRDVPGMAAEFRCAGNVAKDRSPLRHQGSCELPPSPYFAGGSNQSRSAVNKTEDSEQVGDLSSLCLGNEMVRP